MTGLLRDLLPAHRIEEIPVRLGGPDLIDKKFGGLQIIHRVEEFSQYPDLLQNFRFDEKFLPACTGTVDVDGWEYPLFVHATVEMDFHVASSLELFVDHVVHARTSVDQRGGKNCERAAFLD